jgi:hypothetical protein
LDSLQSGKYNYLLENDITFMSILPTKVFDKVFEVWLLQLDELSILWITWLYVFNYFYMCWNDLWTERWWLWEQKNDFKIDILLNTVEQWE